MNTLAALNPAEAKIAECCPTCGAEGERNFLRAPDRLHLRKQEYELVQCPQCSLIWTHDPPRGAAMAYHYGSDYHSGITSMGDSSPSRWKRRQVVLRYKSSGALLDLGCSSGAFLETMKGESWRLYGVEMEAPTAAIARQRTGAEVVIGDLLDARFAPESFDVITSFHVLEHHHSPLALLKRVREWLKPGGVYFVVIPNILSWEARLFRSFWYGLEMPRHLYHFSPASLRRLGEKAGMRVCEMRTRPDTYIEHSIRYLVDGAMTAVGISRVPLAAEPRANLAVKVIRKAFRLSLEYPFQYLAAICGAGASIEAIFQK